MKVKAALLGAIAFVTIGGTWAYADYTFKTEPSPGIMEQGVLEAPKTLSALKELQADTSYTSQKVTDTDVLALTGISSSIGGSATANPVEITKEEIETAQRATMVVGYTSNDTQENQKWTDAARLALKEYFDIDVTGMTTHVVNSSGLPEYDIPATISVSFETEKYNFDKPWYSVYFNPDTGSIEEIYCIDNTKKRQSIPVSLEESKAMAKEFVLSKGLAEESNLKYLGAKTVSEGRNCVSYLVAKDKAILVGIDTNANEVIFFFHRSESNALIQIQPAKAGEGLG